MTCRTTEEITVYGQRDADAEFHSVSYPICIRILDRMGRYEVWGLFDVNAVFCGYFDREIDARIYLIQVAKLAMVNRVFYKRCKCRCRIYFPETTCRKCDTILAKDSVKWRIDDFQIEKRKQFTWCNVAYGYEYKSRTGYSGIGNGSQAGKERAIV